MPQFSEIVGQDQAIDRLAKTLRGRRRPHAMLFAGPSGVGRETVATALASSLLCHDRPADQRDACGACVSCRMLAAGSHPDFLPVYKELAAYHDDSKIRNRVMQEMGIEVVRSFLIAPAQQASAHGKGKVFLVREAEMMSNAAQNALLKTLEEPPAGVTILLLTQRPDMLLPTTRSRCWIVRFASLPHDFVVEKLCAEGLEPDEAQFWAGLTHGSIGRALDMSRRGIFEIKKEIIDKVSRLGPGGDAQLGERLTEIVDELALALVSQSKQADGPDLAKNLATRRGAGEVLEILAEFYRDAMHLRCLALQDRASQLRAVHADQLEAVKRAAGRYSPQTLSEIIEQLSRYERLLWRNLNAKLVWDNVVVTCAAGRPLRLN